jgi:hypothetical protein
MKSKVIPVLFLTEYHAMKAYGETGGVAPHLLDLGTGEWSASRPSRFAPRERAPATSWIGGSVAPSASLDAVVRDIGEN